jgi:hypothetical protein
MISLILACGCGESDVEVIAEYTFGLILIFGLLGAVLWMSR